MDRINNGRSSPQELQRFYGIHVRKLQRIAKHESEGVPNRLKAGRPPVFSEKTQAKLKSACAASTVQLSEEEHEKLLNECLQECLVERNKLAPNNVYVSSQTIRSWEKKLSLRNVTLQKRLRRG